MKIFLDANILFSASRVPSPTRHLIEIFLRYAKAVTNLAAIHEAERNLQQKRPQWLQGWQTLRNKIEVMPLSAPLAYPPLPEKDWPILHGAIEAKCSYLLTSDQQHFGTLYGQVIGGVKIVSMIMLAKEMKAKD